jgi:hypothetical protein
MNIPNLSFTGNKKKGVDRWYPEIHCSLCGNKKYVKAQDLLKTKIAPCVKDLEH